MIYLSHQNGDRTSRISQSLAKKLSFVEADLNCLNSRLRKFAHIFLYAVLAILFGFTLVLNEKTLLCLGVIILFAWADEATKQWISGRHFSWIDVGLNIIGFIIGVVLLLIVINVF